MASWKRVAVLLFVVGWGANHFAALLLVYRAKLALDAAGPTLLFGMYALGLVPSLLLAGPLSDRYGRRAIVLPAAVAALVASSVLGAMGWSFTALLVGRLVYGLGAGGVMSAGAVWLLELSAGTAPGVGARRATIAMSGGFGFGPLVSGLLAQYAPAPTLLPYVVHVVALVGALVLAAGAESPARAAAAAAANGPLLRIGFDRTNRGPFALGVAVMAPFVFAFPCVAFATLPALLGPTALGSAPIAYIGMLGALTLAAGVIAQPLTRRYAPTTSARLGLLVGAAGCALGAIVVAADLPRLLLVTAPLLGAAYGMCMTSGLRTVEQLAAPAVRGGLTGVFYLLTYVGFAAPLVLAIAAQHVSGEAAVASVGVLAVLSAVVLRAPRAARPVG